MRFLSKIEKSVLWLSKANHVSEANLKKEAIKYLDIFKDHPYIFNLGHGILPETNPEMVEHLVEIVKEFKWRKL